MPVTVNTDLPLHPERNTSWDGDAARSAMARRCSGEDGVMADCMGAGFVWREPDENPSAIGSYKLPVANVFDGNLHLVLSGVQAAARSVSPEAEPGTARALSGSESELADIRSAIATILRRFAREFDDEGLRAPWDRPDSQTAAAGPGCSCNCGPAPAQKAASQAQPPKEADMPKIIYDVPARHRVLRASATGGEWRPAAEHFANPNLVEPTKLTVTADGRVFGHLATWDQPHIGYDGKLVYPPKSNDGTYGYFRQSQVMTSDGSLVPVGIITMNTGHADESLSADAAAAHYDNTGTMVAAVNVGEDVHGIWIAGSMLPDVSPDLRTRFSLARVSGDWRQPRPGAGLELIAALSVPNPGFPVRQPESLLQADRMALAASGVIRTDAGEIRTYITAGAAVVDEAQTAAMAQAVREAMTAELMEPMKAMIAEVVRAEMAAKNDTAAVAQSPAEAESTPAPEGEPASSGEAEPVAEGATEQGATEAAVQDAAATDAGAAHPAEAAASAAEAAPASPPDGQVAASALASRVARYRSQNARKRLMAAAGRTAKKA